MKKSYKLYLKFYCLPAILVIIIHLVSLLKYEPIQFDSNEYLSVANNILNKGQYSVSKINTQDFPEFKGESPTRIRQPIYPAFLALIFYILGYSIAAVQLLQLILNLITLFMIVEIGKRIFGADYSSFNNIFLSIYFPLWIQSASILTETLFIFFIIISFRYYIMSSEKNELKLILLSGILLGAAFLTRPIALILFILMMIIILIQKHKNRFKFTIIFGLGFILIITPWTLRNYVTMDEFTPLSSDGGYNFYASTLGSNEKPWVNDNGFRMAVQDGYYLDNNANKRFVELAIKNIFSNPMEYFKYGISRIINTWSYFPGSRLFINNSMVFYSLSLLQFSILTLAVLGWFRFRKKSSVNSLLIPIISFTIVLFFSYSISRFLIPVMPFVLLLTGQSANEIISILKKMFQKKSDNIF